MPKSNTPKIYISRGAEYYGIYVDGTLHLTTDNLDINDIAEIIPDIITVEDYKGVLDTKRASKIFPKSLEKLLNDQSKQI